MAAGVIPTERAADESLALTHAGGVGDDERRVDGDVEDEAVEPGQPDVDLLVTTDARGCKQAPARSTAASPVRARVLHARSTPMCIKAVRRKRVPGGT